MTDKKGKNDDLLSRLDRLQRAAGRGAGAADRVAENPYADAAAGVRKAVEGLTWFGAFVHKVGVMGNFLWEVAGKPVWTVMDPVLGGVARFYKNHIWPYAYTINQEGQSAFSPKRAGIVLTATFAAAAMALPALNTGYEAALMATTMRNETVYLHTVNPHEDGSYSVKGCDNLVTCETKDAAYYNIDTSVARHLWSLFNKGALFVPRRLAGTVSPDSNNKCEIKVYGAYYEKFMQNFETYPNLLDIKCVRVDNDDHVVDHETAPASVQVQPSQQQAPVGSPAPVMPAPGPGL